MFDPSDSVRAKDPDYLMVDNILIKKSDLDTYQLDIWNNALKIKILSKFI